MKLGAAQPRLLGASAGLRPVLAPRPGSLQRGAMLRPLVTLPHSSGLPQAQAGARKQSMGKGVQARRVTARTPGSIGSTDGSSNPLVEALEAAKAKQAEALAVSAWGGAVAHFGAISPLVASLHACTHRPCFHALAGRRQLLHGNT